MCTPYVLPFTIPPPKKVKTKSACGPHKNRGQVNLTGGPQFADLGLDQNILYSVGQNTPG